MATKMRVKETRWVRAGDLLAHPRNWRQHPEYQRAALKGVLDEVGFASVLVAYEDDDGLRLIDGHLRAETEPDLQVPVAVLDVTAAEAEKILATFDPIAAMARPDQDVLLDLLNDATFGDKAVTAMLEALANGETAPLPTPPPRYTDEEQDEANAAAAQARVDADAYDPISTPGTVWALGEHRLMCGEAPGDMEALVKEAEIALVLTDPPYGIGIVKQFSGPMSEARMETGFSDTKARRTGRVVPATGKVGVPGVVAPRVYRTIIGDDGPFDPTWMLTVGKAQIIFGGTYFAASLPEGTSWLAWDKGISEEATFSAFELAWTSNPGRFRIYRHRWSGMVRAGPRNEELQERLHPTQKPVGLLASMLADFSEPGDVILDPYVGSGSTLIACEKMGRTCYAMEIDPRYVDAVVERWEAYTGQKAVKA